MKKEELIKLLKFLNSYYQQKFEYPKSDTEDSKFIQETWYMFLGEYDYSLVRIAVKKLVVKKEWPPTPGEVVKQIEKLKMSDEDKLTGPEAWDQLCTAIHNYGRYREKKLLESLPDRVVKAAKVTGMELIYMKGGDSFIQNRFIKTYEQLQERDFERQMLPGSIKKDIERIGRPEVEKLTDNFKGDNQ